MSEAQPRETAPLLKPDDGAQPDAAPVVATGAVTVRERLGHLGFHLVPLAVSVVVAVCLVLVVLTAVDLHHTRGTITAIGAFRAAAKVDGTAAISGYEARLLLALPPDATAMAQPLRSQGAIPFDIAGRDVRQARTDAGRVLARYTAAEAKLLSSLEAASKELDGVDVSGGSSAIVLAVRTTAAAAFSQGLAAVRSRHGGPASTVTTAQVVAAHQALAVATRRLRDAVAALVISRREDTRVAFQLAALAEAGPVRGAAAIEALADAEAPSVALDPAPAAWAALAGAVPSTAPVFNGGSLPARVAAENGASTADRDALRQLYAAAATAAGSASVAAMQQGPSDLSGARLSVAVAAVAPAVDPFLGRTEAVREAALGRLEDEETARRAWLIATLCLTVAAAFIGGAATVFAAVVGGRFVTADVALQRMACRVEALQDAAAVGAAKAEALSCFTPGWAADATAGRAAKVAQQVVSDDINGAGDGMQGPHLAQFVALFQALLGVLRPCIPQTCFGDLETVSLLGAQSVARQTMQGAAAATQVAPDQAVHDVRTRELRSDHQLQLVSGAVLVLDTRGVLTGGDVERLLAMASGLPDPVTPERPQTTRSRRGAPPSKGPTAPSSAPVPPGGYAVREQVLLQEVEHRSAALLGIVESNVNGTEGIVVGFVGDAIVAVWNVVGACLNHPHQAVRAAVGILQAAGGADVVDTALSARAASPAKRRPKSTKGPAASQVTADDATPPSVRAWLRRLPLSIGVAQSLLVAGTAVGPRLSAGKMKPGREEGAAARGGGKKPALDQGLVNPLLEAPPTAVEALRGQGMRWFEMAGPGVTMAARLEAMNRHHATNIMVAADVAEVVQSVIAAGAVATAGAGRPTFTSAAGAPVELSLRPVGLLRRGPAAGDASERGSIVGDKARSVTATSTTRTAGAPSDAAMATYAVHLGRLQGDRLKAWAATFASITQHIRRGTPREAQRDLEDYVQRFDAKALAPGLGDVADPTIAAWAAHLHGLLE